MRFMQNLRATLKFFRACLLRGTGLLWLVKFQLRRSRAVLVLTFHRVLDDDEFAVSSSLPGILVRKQTFASFTAWIANEFEVLDLAQGKPSWDDPVRGQRIALTFDDGWLDNYEHAAPIALCSGASLMIFVCPGLAGESFPFWPERVSKLIQSIEDRSKLDGIFPTVRGLTLLQAKECIIETLKGMMEGQRDKMIRRLEELVVPTALRGDSEPHNRTMTWEQIQDLCGRGVRIGSHTFNHAILTGLSGGKVSEELQRSRREIESRLGIPCVALAYPNGNHDGQIDRLAEESGYELAFTTEPGVWTKETNCLRIPRINISEPWLVGPRGRFSKAMSEYAIFWTAWRRAG
jgi:peptidoglycan/xylan/chitin deacetylase (PgdA/CDA1 family)